MPYETPAIATGPALAGLWAAGEIRIRAGAISISISAASNLGIAHQHHVTGSHISIAMVQSDRAASCAPE